MLSQANTHHQDVSFDLLLLPQTLSAVILTSDDDQEPSPLSLSSSRIPFPVSFPSPLLLPQTLSRIHKFCHQRLTNSLTGGSPIPSALTPSECRLQSLILAAYNGHCYVNLLSFIAEDTWTVGYALYILES
ncbi:hypothetical protein RJT34_12026 [Clitoria ternatea]|uniref:Uncharacterized protein n=1 Tax=Clitoria ternatea TaxID=43366 RepID=A0AAN9JL14_CLITE